MAYIIFATTWMQQALGSAALYLRDHRHRVDSVTHGDELLRLMDVEQPDVLVLGGLLHGVLPPALLTEIPTRYPGIKTQLIWITVSDNGTGYPTFFWDWGGISSFLIPPCSEWQIIVAIEQLIYRTVLVPPWELHPE